MKIYYYKLIHYLELLRLKLRIFRAQNFGTVFSTRALIIMFVLAFALGTGIKALVNDVVTIGYEDYKLRGSENALNLSQIQKDVIEKGETLAVGDTETPYGEVCSE